MAKQKSLKGENLGTKEVIGRLRKGGMSDEDIEESGIYKFKEPKPAAKPSRARQLISKIVAKYRQRRDKGVEKYMPKMPVPKPTQRPQVDLDTKEKELVASGKDPNKVAAMKRAILNRRKLAEKKKQD